LNQEISKKKLDERNAKNLAKYSDIIAMWEQGLRTADQMAIRAHGWTIAFVSRINAAKRLGVIKDEVMGDGSVKI
jgi:hypothetical protein